ncbi:MAG: prepilin-type N-terminal cleavage/methylation domain-containing protein [Candidatus Omnitrophica bacterium]|jgi:prepilin-type N-terminal cleavage/methylation domain-containing protein|nr:prepilin-type N-terminal cleavage/methylation domain-containing protein [Candidatus Omnitrophota bacterium]
MKNIRKGFTLIEAVVAIVITGILAAFGSMIIMQVIDSWNTVSFRAESVAQGRWAAARMSRQIRSVRNSTNVWTAGPGAFKFTTYDGSNITYNVSSNNLLENNIVLAQDVARLNFTYYNATGGVITSPVVAPSQTNINRLSFEIEIRSGGQSKVMNTSVYPRNLGG